MCTSARNSDGGDVRGEGRDARGVAGGRWARAWLLGWSALSGLLALAWVVLRSGSKPTRLAYPCQQAALGTAAVAFAGPVAGALVALRRQAGRALRTRGGVAVAALGLVVTLGLWGYFAQADGYGGRLLAPPAEYHPDVYLVNDARGILPGRYGGVDDLITLMGLRGLKWYRSATESLTSGPEGLIDADDVVLIKVNAQWSQRGGTNTDVVRGILRRIVEHPDGFTGEIIVADNGQGSGNLDRSQNNAEDHGQSFADVVNDFRDEGWRVQTYLWDVLRDINVSEYSEGDMRDGYVVASEYDPETYIKVSYPKFRTEAGTYVSYKYGIWSPLTQTYDADRLVVINVPVFKTHSIYAITASVKNHMGVVTRTQGTDSHAAVGRGGMGTILAEVRMPDLTILDCIWILARPGYGPSASYSQASRRDQLVASRDPVALDVWAAKYIMIPQIIENGYSYEDYHYTQDPDNPNSVFRRYMDRSMSEMLAAGIPTTNDYNAVRLHVWAGDADRDGDVDISDFSTFTSCFGGSGTPCDGECCAVDFDGDGDVDIADFSTLATNFTGSF